jgi:hypothetical protein
MYTTNELAHPYTLKEGQYYYHVQGNTMGEKSLKIVEFVAYTSSPESVVIMSRESGVNTHCSRYDLFDIPQGLVCPECERPTLVHEEGCLKCYSCWYFVC